MTKQLIQNTLDKILYKGKYAKKDTYSYNNEMKPSKTYPDRLTNDPNDWNRCTKCNKALEEGESKICNGCETKVFPKKKR
jgi:hypothetical protein